MALQISYTTDNGITLPAAYCRIGQIKHGHSETTVDVCIFATEGGRVACLPLVSIYSFSIPWADAVSLSLAYTSLKNEEMFAGAIDV